MKVGHNVSMAGSSHVVCPQEAVCIHCLSKVEGSGLPYHIRSGLDLRRVVDYQLFQLLSCHEDWSDDLEVLYM